MTELTPAEQKLLNFLDKLATSPYSTQLMEEGNRVLDAAVEENQRLQDSIHQASNAMRSAQQCAFLEGGIQ
jgi:transcription initiation factor IIF auxiliary subunit